MTDTLPVSRAAELDDAAQTPRWLVTDLWASAGVGVIGGHPKSCKSWLGLELATAVATATPALGRFHVPAPATALVYLAEDALHSVKERLVALCAHRRLHIESLDVHVITAPTLRLDRASDIQRLDNTLSAIHPRLLLLDPLVRLHSGDENSSTEISRLLDSLRALQRKHDTAIVLVHHTRKSGAHRQGQALRGSSDIWAFGDSNLFINQLNSKLVLSVEHRAAPAPDSITIALTGDPPHLNIVDDDSTPPSLEQRVMDELTRASTPLSRTELRRRLAVNNKKLGDTIDKLVHSGSVARTQDGITIFQLSP